MSLFEFTRLKDKTESEFIQELKEDLIKIRKELNLNDVERLHNKVAVVRVSLFDFGDELIDKIIKKEIFTYTYVILSLVKAIDYIGDEPFLMMQFDKLKEYFKVKVDVWLEVL